MPDAVDLDALALTAEHTLTTQRWRDDLRAWAEETRPAAMAASRALLEVELGTLDDASLADHVDQAVAHYQQWAPEHFALMSVGATAGGALLEAAESWGLDRRALFESLAGSAGATASGQSLLDRIATGLREVGVADVESLDDVRRVGGDAVAALDELLLAHGARTFGTDLSPTLAERPDALVALVRAALRATGPRAQRDPAALERHRDLVPEGERDRFDDLAAVAQLAYGFNDDNTVVLFSLPLGVVRRAVLAVGVRLADRGRIDDPADAFEATPGELRDVLLGAGPAASLLAERTAERKAADAVTPPAMVGSPLPEEPPLELPDATRRLDALVNAWWSAGATAPTAGRAAATVGTEVVRGRAVVSRDPVELLFRVEPGDVLVTGTTNATYNVVFPLVAAVATEQGGPMSHPAILARELGLTAVIGVPDLFDRVHDGDQVEVDPIAGTITVLDPAT